MEPYVITHSFIFNKKISRYLPGGAHSNFFHDTSNRLHFRQIRGSRCVDLDGNEYVDLMAPDRYSSGTVIRTSYHL